jgi:hypothetical protein
MNSESTNRFANANILVEVNLVDDLRAMLSSKLSIDGYKVDADVTAATLVRHDLQLQQRRIEQRARRVSWSRELRDGAREAELRGEEVLGQPANSSQGYNVWDALSHVEVAVTTGADLNLYTSRDMAPSNQRAFKKADWMLNDTGIHHLHLGRGRNRGGQVNGTKQLLFVVVGSEVVYFVEVFDHSSPADKCTSWADERAFQIAQANWPELFEHAKFSGSGLTHRPLTHAERTALSKKNGNALLTAADGTTYFQPGGGSTPGGVPMKAVMETDDIWHRLIGCEHWCKANGGLLASEIEARGWPRPSSLSLRLAEIPVSGTAIVVEDRVSAVRFRLA